MTDQEVTEYLVLEDADPTGDVAIVFGVNRFWRPADRAIELYASWKIPKIIFSGGLNKYNGVNEAKLMAQYANDHGVPETDILIDDQSNNTLENVLNAKKLIDETVGLDQVKTIVGICLEFHSRRAAMTLKKHFPEGTIIKMAPYAFSDVNRDNWTESEKWRTKVYEEVDKIETYLAKGDIAEL